MPDLAPAPSFRFQRWLDAVERAGNALPHPATLFAGLAALVVLLSWVCHSVGVAVRHPSTGALVESVNLLSVAGLQRMLQEAPGNFLAFPPLGVTLVSLLGLGIAEYSGLMGAGLRMVALATPRKLITPAVVFAGVMSNAAGEAGYVLLIPLAAALFHALGRHPVAGLAAAFAGVSGGYSANLLVSAVDVLLAGITQAAAQIVDPGRQVTGMANWYFMAASTFLITAAGVWVTERLVAPRLGDYRGSAPREDLQPLAPRERRGLWAAGLAAALLAAFVLGGVLPANGYLINPANPSFAKSAFMEGLPAFLLLFGLLPGLAYGVVAGTVRSDHDAVAGMTRTMQTMGSFLVLSFFAAQFIAYFNWTNLGVICAVKGAESIQRLGLGNQPAPLMLALVLFAAAVNLLISSASAKWALLAPVFVPMFMLLGFSPELVQGAFRVGDSVTNIITPLMAYFPLVLVFVQKYEPRAGIGTLVSTMLPYSIVFLAGWMAMLVAWILTGVPMGPGAPLFLAR